jgi:diguanylate cyclase (GGDEF)-like protein
MRYRNVSTAAAILAGSLGLLTLLEYLGVPLHLDELVFRDPYSTVFPGRMAHITAINLVILAVAQIALSRKSPMFKVAQSCAGLVALSSGFAILGYLYGVPLLYGSLHYTAMALHTGACFLLLSMGVLVASSEGGFLSTIRTGTVSSVVPEIFLPAGILIPSLIGLLVMRGPFSNLDPKLAPALIVVLNIVLFVLLGVRTSVILHRMEEARENAERLSNIDPLTQLANRRAFDATMKSEIVRARRLKLPLSVVVLDVDRFKQINDQHGHAQGDAVLKSLAAMWKNEIREIDLLARFGGEEFVLVAPGTPADGGFAVAEKLRKLASRCDAHPGITVSCGMATFPADGESAEELFSVADAALYRAKAAGRNCTERGRAVPAD